MKEKTPGCRAITWRENISPMSSNKRQRSRRSPVSSRRKKTGRLEKKSIIGGATEWFSAHRPVFLFLLAFGALMGVFYGVSIFAPFFKRHFLPAYLNWTTRAAGAILGVITEEVTVRGNSISAAGFGVSIAMGCSAVEPIGLFVSAVLAFPAPILKKLAGAVVGALFLLILNQVRIVSLVLLGVHWPRVFHFMHVDMWQALLIVLAITFWVFWLLWATKKQIKTQAVPC